MLIFSETISYYFVYNNKNKSICILFLLTKNSYFVFASAKRTNFACVAKKSFAKINNINCIKIKIKSRAK